jgi:hypothetical protein
MVEETRTRQTASEAFVVAFYMLVSSLASSSYYRQYVHRKRQLNFTELYRIVSQTIELLNAP